MDFTLTDDQATIRAAVADLAGKFDDQYWLECDRDKRFPAEFYDTLATGGWLGSTTPEEYGGHGFGITEASILIEEVAKSGGGMNAASAIHLSIFGMHPVIKHGSEELKRRTLPRIVDGSLHVCFGVTEPGAGLDTTRITTFARREGDHYRVNGRKVWISKARESEKVLLLTRTQKIDEVAKKTDGMTLFLTDLDRTKIDIRAIPKMGRNAVTSNELFIDDLLVPAADRVGKEGRGFTYILDGLNPERMLVATEALGLGRVALNRAVRYANQREVFGRPIGMNQGLQFPLADSLARLDAAELVLRKATWLSTTRASPAGGRPTPPSTCVPTRASRPPTGRCRLRKLRRLPSPRELLMPALDVFALDRRAALITGGGIGAAVARAACGTSGSTTRTRWPDRVWHALSGRIALERNLSGVPPRSNPRHVPLARNRGRVEARRHPPGPRQRRPRPPARRGLVSINSAIEVDLTGQVGAETAGGRYVGGIGGQADFSGAAARTGARSIMALRSTAAGASTVVPALRGPVTTARADVDVVVTEHGIAWLRGCPLSQRAARLIEIAAPEHRDHLHRAVRENA